MNSVRTNNVSLKYQRFAPPGFKHKRIVKFKTQDLRNLNFITLKCFRSEIRIPISANIYIEVKSMKI